MLALIRHVRKLRSIILEIPEMRSSVCSDKHQVYAADGTFNDHCKHPAFVLLKTRLESLTRLEMDWWTERSLTSLLQHNTSTTFVRDHDYNLLGCLGLLDGGY